jgi:hydroxymethylglutaryl-CoA lyase
LDRAIEKIEAAFLSGCQRFDGALKGFGGCPMAEDELVGNLATEKIVSYLSAKGELLRLNQGEFAKAMMMADTVFPKS